jgi:hypothetical protein
MPIRASLLLIVMAMLCNRAAAEEKYTFKEKLQPGEKIAGEITYYSHDKSTTKEKDKPAETSDVVMQQSVKLTETVLEVKDGSSVGMRVEVDAGSTDSTKSSGQDEVKTPFAFAGKTVKARRKADGSVSLDFKDEVNPDDTEIIKSLLNPDQDFYPQHPVAVGDTWDVSDKLARHAELGKDDKLKAQCRLDWVKMVDGKQMAQISVSCAVVRHDEGNVESDIEEKATIKVDVAAGMIVECDQTNKSTDTTPADEPVQVKGTSESKYHSTAALITEAPAKP